MNSLQSRRSPSHGRNWRGYPLPSSPLDLSTYVAGPISIRPSPAAWIAQDPCWGYRAALIHTVQVNDATQKATPIPPHRSSLPLLGLVYSQSTSALRPAVSSHNKVTNEEVRPFGFKVLYESLASSTTVDIIAVHGLNGHREESWTDTEINERSSLWLRDFLPKSIPSARVISYGYDATLGGPSLQTLSGHAQDFVVRLTHYRIDTSSVMRPIVFVVHGTGGIVVQQALLEASRATLRHLPDHQDIRLSTFGIIFLGTPHQGLSYSSGVSSATLSQAALSRNLQPNSEYLQDMVAMFTSIREDFEIKFVYETRVEAGQTELTVPKYSATVAGAVNIEMLGLNRDHSALARFSSELDGDYQVLMSMMANMAKKAPKAVEARWRTKMLSVQANLNANTVRNEELLGQCPSAVTVTALSQPEENIRLFLDGQPPAPSLFLGRDQELKEMREVLLKYSAPRLAILGPGGIGKTTVAQQLMNDPEVRQRFATPLFVHCEHATTTITILSTIADVLHIPSNHRGQSLQTNVFNELKSRHGVLLCLDNFEDAWDPPAGRSAIEAFLALLDGIPAIAVILTMRGTERPRGLNWVRPCPPPLDPLDDKSARVLFEATSNCTEEGLQTLLEAVDNIPLAIKLLAALVEEEGLEYVLQEWKRDGLRVLDRGDESDHRMTSVTASIALSLNSPRISAIPHLRHIIFMLAILPGGLSNTMINALAANLPQGFHIPRTLQALRRISLCFLDANGRYRVLSTIRQYIEACVSAEPFVLRALAVAFLKHVIDKAEPAYYENIIPELSNIRSFVTSPTGTWDELRVQACIDYLWWENYHSGIQDIPLACEALAHAHTPLLEVRCRIRLAELLRFCYRHIDAQECLDRALTTNTVGLYWCGRVQLELGRTLLMLHKYEDAQRTLQQAVVLFREADKPDWEASALERMGNIYYLLGHLTLAEHPLKRSLELARQAKDLLLEGNALLKLGDVYSMGTRTSEAEDTLLRAIGCFQQSHTSYNEAQALQSLARVQCDQRRFGEAERNLMASRELFIRIHDSDGEAATLWSLGQLLVKMDDRLDQAEQYFRGALNIDQQNRSSGGQAVIHHALASLLLRQNHRNAALNHLVVSVAFHLRRLHGSTWGQVNLICDQIQGLMSAEDLPSFSDNRQILSASVLSSDCQVSTLLAYGKTCDTSSLLSSPTKHYKSDTARRFECGSELAQVKRITPSVHGPGDLCTKGPGGFGGPVRASRGSKPAPRAQGHPKGSGNPRW